MLPYIHIFGIELPMYGILIAIGTLLCFLMLEFTPKHRDINPDNAFDCALWCAILGLVGAKLLYIIVEFRSLIEDPAGFLKSVLTGGLVFYGGLIGGIAGGFIYMKRHKITFRDMADILAPPFVLVHAFGRIGCFCAGCCYGMPADTFISVVYPSGVGSFAPTGVPMLPTQLMEAIFLFFLCFYLYRVLVKDGRSGIVLGKYITAYSVWRFLIEFLRSDERGTVGFLSTSQAISLVLIPIGIYFILTAKKNIKHLAM